MSIFELLFLNRDYLFCLKSLGIKIEDSDFIDLFVEYERQTELQTQVVEYGKLC